MKSNKRKPNRIEKDILTCIGHAILDHNDRDYEETYGVLDSIRIHGLKYKKHLVGKDEVVITLQRLGLFIGKNGELINKIEKKIGWLLGRSVYIELVEYEIDVYLFPHHPYDDLYDDLL